MLAYILKSLCIHWLLSVVPPTKHTFSGSIPLPIIHFQHLALIHASFWGVTPPLVPIQLAKSEGVNPPLCSYIIRNVGSTPPYSWTSWGRGFLFLLIFHLLAWNPWPSLEHGAKQAQNYTTVDPKQRVDSRRVLRNRVKHMRKHYIRTCNIPTPLGTFFLGGGQKM